MIKLINNTILNEASKLRYTVADKAPSNEIELFNSPTLVIWTGSSDNTIFQDAKVNWAFRALHDALHLKTRLNFTPDAEIELGRIQASKYTGLLADLVYCEVSMQALHYKQHGTFVVDQVEFTLNYLRSLGYVL